MYFLNNLGPLILAFLFYLLAIFILIALDKFVSWSTKLARVTTSMYDALFYNTITSIVMESYSLMSCCVMINMNYIYWNNWGEIVQNTICLLSLATLIIFPAACVIYSRDTWELNMKHKRNKIAPFFDELDVKKG